MPRYLNINGRTVEEYSPDGYSKVRIVDVGYEYNYVVEPVILNHEETAQLDEVMDRLSYEVEPRGLLRAEVLEKYLRDWGLSDRVVYTVLSQVIGYSWLEPLMRDEYLEDIQCFKSDLPLRVTHRSYGLVNTNIVPSGEEVDRMVRLLAYRGGSSVSVFRAREDSVILPTGDRCALTFRSEISPTSSFTIRKFPRRPWTPTKMIRTGMVTPEAMALLWLCIDAKLPIMVFGAMGTGKTSFINALAMLIRPDASITLVQDAPEMRIFHENVLSLYERKSTTAGETGRVTLEDLLAHALRRSVDYVSVNEVRSRREVYSFAQAVALGHGGLTSIHTDSVEGVFARLKGYGVEEPLAENIKVVVGTGLFLAEREGKRVRLRRVKGIYFVRRLEDYRPVYDVLYEYDPSKDTLVEKNNSIVDYLADRLYITPSDLHREWKKRTTFLELSFKAGVFEGDELFPLLKEFRHDPHGTIEKLKAMTMKAKPVPEEKYLVIASMEEVKYCPHCGYQLPARARSCPKCGFVLIPRIPKGEVEKLLLELEERRGGKVEREEEGEGEEEGKWVEV